MNKRIGKVISLSGKVMMQSFLPMRSEFLSQEYSSTIELKLALFPTLESATLSKEAEGDL